MDDSQQEMGLQSYNHKELNSPNNHMSLKEDPALQKGAQTSQHLDFSFVRSSAKDSGGLGLDSRPTETEMIKLYVVLNYKFVVIFYSGIKSKHKYITTHSTS